MATEAVVDPRAEQLLRCIDAVYLADFCDAASACAAVGPRRYLHAGPSIAPQDTLGPMRGALIAALLYEGEATSVADAARIIRRGEIDLIPCHSVGGVGALAGIVSPHTPVVVVESAAGRRAFAPLNEGLGRATRFGNHDDETLGRLVWLSRVVAPSLSAALRHMDPIDMLHVQAEGLRRGDECHNRNVASSALLTTRMAPAIVEAAASTAFEVLRELSMNAQFFLALSMATAKCVADAMHEQGPPGLVTAIAANGVEIGIRVSGTKSQWFVAPSVVEGPILLEGFSIDDVCPAMGDSAVAETIGLGAFALTAAPGLARTLGLDNQDARELVAGFRAICLAESALFLIPWEDFRGSPFGIAVDAVVQSGITPAFTSGYAHREPGRGRVGAGLVRVPLPVFQKAHREIDPGQ